MSRRSLLLAVAIALSLIGSTLATLILLIRHEPESYRQAGMPPGTERAARSAECLTEITQLINASINRERELDIRLTDVQLNSYFAEDFSRSGLAERLLPEGIHDPRVVLEPGRVRLAFRYGQGLWSAVISIDFGVWLCAEELNVVAFELLGLHAGSLPVGAQAFLDNLSQIAEQNGVQVTWFRHPQSGNPVALLRFQNEQREVSVQLQGLKIDQGVILLRGRPVDSDTSPTARMPISAPNGD